MSFQVLEIRRTTFNGLTITSRSTIQYSNATFITPTKQWKDMQGLQLLVGPNDLCGMIL